MTLLMILNLFASAGSRLVDFLTRVGQAAPDLKPTADEWIARLTAAVSFENLAAVGAAVLKELSDIARFKIVPKDHPSDAA